jgi:hypothetical protein
LPPSSAAFVTLANLASASGGQDHTPSPSAVAALVWRSIRVHRIPASRVVTIARTSLLPRQDARTYNSDFRNMSSGILGAVLDRPRGLESSREFRFSTYKVLRLASPASEVAIGMIALIRPTLSRKSVKRSEGPGADRVATADASPLRPLRSAMIRFSWTVKRQWHGDFLDTRTADRRAWSTREPPPDYRPGLSRLRK